MHILHEPGAHPQQQSAQVEANSIIWLVWVLEIGEKNEENWKLII